MSNRLFQSVIHQMKDAVDRTIGVIDADYRGEVHVCLRNNGTEPFTVVRGDRIAQLMFLPVLTAVFEETDELDETARGTGGFGSTGVK